MKKEIIEKGKRRWEGDGRYGWMQVRKEGKKVKEGRRGKGVEGKKVEDKEEG